MGVDYLNALNNLVKKLLKDEAIKENIQDLKMNIRGSEEPFIWKVINIDSFKQKLPSAIKSIWIFVLKKDIPSIAHYHPNSTQHTVVIEGKGKVKIADLLKDLRIFGPSNSSKEDAWCVIDKNVPHEFFPEEEMVVFSFHTCSPKELIEIRCDDGQERAYEK